MAELTCGVRKLDGTFEQFEFSFGSKSIGIDSEMEKLDYDVNAGWSIIRMHTYLQGCKHTVASLLSLHIKLEK